ncbi:MAG: RluA family pseudouridine synthase [Oscillospiraceae bacterium]|nr:RluA family pseudouridine synthase [Oscillospiraceae bacterium]
MELRLTAAREGRLSSFLLGELNMSTGLMNKLKWGDGIRVNGVPRRTNFDVKPGDMVTVRLDEEEPEYPPEDGPLSVLYEDDWLLVVDKPAGMLIHPSRAKNDGTLANFVAGYYRKTGQKCAFHPMTRLDRDTFGIVLLAKNAHIHTRLQAADVKKTYHALVFGGPEGEQGIIDAPIARKPLPSLLREIREDGKPSVTEFRVLEKYDGYARLALRPITGRTHQLRVHCAYMGFPILGDPQYGSEESQSFSRTLGLPHQMLCAKRLEFSHPITGEAMALESGMDAQLRMRSEE